MGATGWDRDHRGLFRRRYEIEDKEAIPNPQHRPRAVWKIRTPIEDVAIAIANYDLGNVPIWEDLENVGMEYPYDERFEQTTVSRFGRDFHKSMDADFAPYIIALPGVYETTTEEQTCRHAEARPVTNEDGQWHLVEEYRLTLEAAREAGLEQRWTPSARKVDQETWARLDRGGTVPEGAILFKQCFDDEDGRWKCDRLQK